MKKGKKVFVVTSGSYSDYTIEAIFSSKEKAQKYIKYYKKIKPAMYPDFNRDIEEYFLDIPKEDIFSTSVVINKEGEVLGAYILENPCDFISFNLNDLIISVKTIDKERAIKIATEYFYNIKNTGLWGKKDEEKLRKILRCSNEK